MSVTFDLAQDPNWEELLTATSALTGKKINRFNQDMVLNEVDASLLTALRGAGGA